MDERAMMIGEWLQGDASVSGLASKYRVSRKSVGKWIARYEAGGWEALADRSRAALKHPNAVSPEVEATLLEIKATRPLWGAPKVRWKLLQAVGKEHCPAESTVSAILRRHGLSREAKRRKRAVPLVPFGECLAANDVWGTDFKGPFLTADGLKCMPLTISDNHSRFLLCCHGMGGATGMEAVKPLFIRTFREHGLPTAMRTDNGPPFASCGLHGLSELSVWWLLLGIRLERITPGRPQQNGRHERMHRTLKEATADPPHANLRTQQKAFDVFRKDYNEERPHEALGQRPPAEVYQASERLYNGRKLCQAGYPEGWPTRKVRKGGQVKWKGKELQISQALKGLEVGFNPASEGCWSVHFEGLDLGIFDERKRPTKGIMKLQAGVDL
jgi:putative transposase